MESPRTPALKSSPSGNVRLLERDLSLAAGFGSKLIAHILILLDAVVWFLSLGFVKLIYNNFFAPVLKQSKASVVAHPAQGEEEVFSDTWRRTMSSKELWVVPPHVGADNIFAAFEHVASTRGHFPCMSYREIIEFIHPPPTLGAFAQAPAVTKSFGRTITLTYADIKSRARAIGMGLIDLGCKCQPLDFMTATGPYTITMYEDTCAEWLTTAFGAWSQGIVVSTVYATLGLDSVVTAMNQSGGSVVLCNRSNVKALLKMSTDIPSLRVVVYTNSNCDQTTIASGNPCPDHPNDSSVQVVSFDDLVKRGETFTYRPYTSTPESISVVMYTSGSTGKPKGVVLNNKNMIATYGCVGILGFRMYNSVKEQIRFVAYLPVAHIMELTTELGVLSTGSHVCYADPRSLSDNFSKPHGALREFKPRFFSAVPKIYDIFQKAAQAKIAALPAGKQYLVKAALKAKISRQRRGMSTPLLDAIVFNKFKEIWGGQCTKALAAGGPVSQECSDFCKAAFGVGLMQAYGMTETAGVGAMQSYNATTVGVAGYPQVSVELKLRSCVDPITKEAEVLDKAGKPYLVTDRSDWRHKSCKGRGEVYIRGPGVFRGYYKEPELTKKAVTEDGWVKTGDVGLLHDDGTLEIVDRVKNLVKLRGGEYIALENMEMVYSQSKFVDAIAGGIMCYGDGSMDRPVAIIQANALNLVTYAKARELHFETAEELCGNKFAMKIIKDDLDKLWKEGGLYAIEKLAVIHVVLSPWTSANGGLTATNKVSRHGVVAMHTDAIEAMKAQVAKGLGNA